MRLEGAVLTPIPEDRQRAVMRWTVRDVGGRWAGGVSSALTGCKYSISSV